MARGYRPGAATPHAAALGPEDGPTWRFRLREGVRFHEGRPPDAGRAAATLRRAADRPGNLERLPLSTHNATIARRRAPTDRGAFSGPCDR